MGMFIKGGDDGASWWTSSKTDPRFNMNGRCGANLFSIEAACRAAIEAKEKELGVKRPDDTEIGGMKD